MFRIDKSSVEYQKGAPPYVVTISREHSDKTPSEKEREAVSLAAPQPVDDKIQRAARLEAEKILSEARAASEKLKKQAIKEAESIKTQSYNEAKRRGEEEAAKIAAEREMAANKEVASLISRLNESLNESLSATVKVWEEELLDLSIEISRKIINVELDRNDQAFRSLVQNALSHMRGDAKVTIHVSPSEYEKYFKSGDVIFQVGGENVKTIVTDDPLLERGGCVVESEGEMINAGVEQQLKAMRTAMDKDGA